MQEMLQLQSASFILKTVSFIMTHFRWGIFLSQTISWLDTYFIQNYMEN